MTKFELATICLQIWCAACVGSNKTGSFIMLMAWSALAIIAYIVEA